MEVMLAWQLTEEMTCFIRCDAYATYCVVGSELSAFEIADSAIVIAAPSYVMTRALFNGGGAEFVRWEQLETFFARTVAIFVLDLFICPAKDGKEAGHATAKAGANDQRSEEASEGGDKQDAGASVEEGRAFAALLMGAAALDEDEAAEGERNEDDVEERLLAIGIALLSKGAGGVDGVALEGEGNHVERVGGKENAKSVDEARVLASLPSRSTTGGGHKSKQYLGEADGKLETEHSFAPEAEIEHVSEK